ncbi:MAG: AAA family ATPase [Desulfobulbaceae bacterium]|nr:AAA family ATPase [Desulfobulbaceae bacterium]HIJ90192.1 ATP-dependent Clp protease ATP-binding subunit [Deltaproteobacteria bacterium]
MQEIIFQISGLNTSEQVNFILSEQELLDLREQAGDQPLSPLIVKKIESKSRRHGYLLATDVTDLYKVAKEIIVAGERSFSLHGYPLEQPTVANHQPQGDDLIPTAGSISQPLVSYGYQNPIHDLEKLQSHILQREMIPLLWNNATGFETSNLSQQFPLLTGPEATNLKDPRQALRFIINNSQHRTCYIFEDIHHFIGDKNSIGPTFGEIRSLVKELYRALRDRNEQVYFFVPSSYEWPVEIYGFLEKSVLNRDSEHHKRLERFAELMTSAAYIKKIKPVIGSKALISRIIQTLAQKESNNPLLVGHPGVGKTALVEGFAIALFNGDVPPVLQERMLYKLSLSSLVAGTKYRGEMEARLEELMEAVSQHKDEIILFIDEIHGLLDAGMAKGGFGIGDILKPVLSRGEFPLIGATTFAGADHLAMDTALTRRFKTIVLDEPSPESTLEIMRGVRSSFEQHHHIEIDDSALSAAIRLSGKSGNTQFLPGRAIALIDCTAAYCRMNGLTMVREIDVLREVKE